MGVMPSLGEFTETPVGSEGGSMFERVLVIEQAFDEG